MWNGSVDYVRSAIVPALAALAVLISLSSPVAAQASPSGLSVPSKCTAKALHMQKYQQGASKGTQRADELFASSEIAQNPDKLRKKIDRVLHKLSDHIYEAIRNDSSDGRKCRVQGVADGFISRIVQLLGQCILDGAQWGQFSANLYCDLSLQLGGLGASDELFVRAPVGLCGTMFQGACDGVYTYVATEGATRLSTDVARFCKDRNIAPQPYPGCSVYTQGNFASIFKANRLVDCAYSAQ